MTYKATSNRIKTRLTTKTSIFGLIAILGVTSMISVDSLAHDKGQSSFLAMAQTSLWQLGDLGNLYYSGGKVGIGTENPASDLTIVDGRPTFSLSTPGTHIRDQAFMNMITKDNNANGAFEPGEKGWHIAFRGDNYTSEDQHNDLYFERYNDGWTGVPLAIDFDTNNVGIGTTIPQEVLDVNGNIRFEGNLVSDNDICIGNCP